MESGHTYEWQLKKAVAACDVGQVRRLLRDPRLSSLSHPLSVVVAPGNADMMYLLVTEGRECVCVVAGGAGGGQAEYSWGEQCRFPV